MRGQGLVWMDHESPLLTVKSKDTNITHTHTHTHTKVPCFQFLLHMKKDRLNRCDYLCGWVIGNKNIPPPPQHTFMRKIEVGLGNSNHHLALKSCFKHPPTAVKEMQHWFSDQRGGVEDNSVNMKLFTAGRSDQRFVFSFETFKIEAALQTVFTSAIPVVKENAVLSSAGCLTRAFFYYWNCDRFCNLN